MHRVVRPIALMLGFAVATAFPARASSVRLNEVAQTVITTNENHPALRLRSVTQNANTFAANVAANTTQTVSAATASTANASSTNANASATLATLQDGQVSAVGVQDIQIGDVTGTICDCGEIAVPGGGFPKFPLLALAAIPLALIPFIGGGGSTGSPSIIPTPTTPTPVTPTTPTPIPEPATMLLLGTGLVGLGANARRRRQQAREQAEHTTLQHTSGKEI